MVTMDRQYETTYAKSNGHVTSKGQTRDPKIFEAPYLNIYAR